MGYWFCKCRWRPFYVYMHQTYIWLLWNRWNYYNISSLNQCTGCHCVYVQFGLINSKYIAWFSYMSNEYSYTDNATMCSSLCFVQMLRVLRHCKWETHQVCYFLFQHYFRMEGLCSWGKLAASRSWRKRIQGQCQIL